MRGVNKVVLVGNLGKDPEVRYTQSGVAVCNFSIAVTENRKKGDGWEEHTEWVRILCFQKMAENVGQFCSKGSRVYVEGRLQTKEFEKDGVKRWATDVVANEILFLSTRQEGGGTKPPEPNDGFYEEDLPF